MARYLRIAAAVTFALLACAVIGLWVRSYWRLQILETQSGLHAAQISSVEGHVAIARLGPGTRIGQPYLSVVAGDSADWRREGVLGFANYEDGSITALILPHWFLAASSLALAVLFACKRTWRFTIRTLLIATTLIAGALGLGVYLL
jgi:hypothetical protein